MHRKENPLRRAREVAGRAERLSKLSLHFGEEAERLAEEAAQCLRHARNVCARAKSCADEALRLLATAERPLTAAERPSAFRPALPAAPRRTILVIDDDDSLITTFALTLRLEGYQVRTALNAAHGLDQAQGGLDAIIVDYHLPQDDGLRLLRDLRAKRHSTTPIAIVTADSFLDEGVSRELSALGAQVWLKPIWGAELVKRIGRLMSMSSTS